MLPPTKPETEGIKLTNGTKLGAVCLTGLNGKQLEVKVFSGPYAGDTQVLLPVATTDDLRPITGSTLPPIGPCSGVPETASPS